MDFALKQDFWYCKRAVSCAGGEQAQGTGEKGMAVIKSDTFVPQLLCNTDNISINGVLHPM